MMKILEHVLVALLVVGVVLLGRALLQQNERTTQARVQVSALQVRLDTAQATADGWQAKADSMGKEMDALQRTLVLARAQAYSVVAVAQDSVTKLERALVGLVPPGAVQDSVAALVANLNGQHQAQMDEYAALLGLQDATIARLNQQVVAQERANAGLRQALQLATSQRDALARAGASPSLLQRIHAEAGLLSGAAALGVLATLAVGR